MYLHLVDKMEVEAASLVRRNERMLKSMWSGKALNRSSLQLSSALAGERLALMGSVLMADFSDGF